MLRLFCLCCATTAAASRLVGLSVGDRWLRPTQNHSIGAQLIMDDPGSAADWTLTPDGRLTLVGSAKLCIVPAACHVGSMLQLGEHSCMQLNGSNLATTSSASACQNLCADAEGWEHEVTLARCSSQTKMFRAVDAAPVASGR